MTQCCQRPRTCEGTPLEDRCALCSARDRAVDTRYCTNCWAVYPASEIHECKPGLGVALAKPMLEVTLTPGIQRGDPYQAHVDAMHHSYATPHSESHRRTIHLEMMAESAQRTLTALGYTYHGGEQWKPPLAEAPKSGMHLNSSKSVAVADDYFFNEDMAQCPHGVKVQLLGQGGVASYGHYNGDPFWIGWAPVPRRRPR